MKSKVLKLFTIAVFVALPVSIGLAQNQQPKNHPPQYTVVDLGTPLGGFFAIGMSINSLGWVGGYANLPSNTSQHAALWLYGSTIDLGTLGGPNSALYGTYSGFAETSGSDPLGQDFCEYGDYLICLPFVLNFNSLVPLPTLGGYSAVAFGNNDLNQVVGTSLTATQDPSCLVDGQPQPPFYKRQGALPAIWENGRIKPLAPLPGDSRGTAYAINDRGQVVGWSGDCVSNTTAHALLWNNGKVVNLGSLGGVTNNVAASINNLVEVTGNSDLSGDATYHAFLWRNGKMTDLGTLPGDYLSYGNAINDEGQIVGASCDINGNCRPFLWENGTMIDLNTLIPANSNLYLLDASTINDLGEIVGYAYDATTGNLPAFLAVVCRDCNEAQAAAVSAAAKVALPDNVRKLVQQRLKSGRFGVRMTQPQ